MYSYAFEFFFEKKKKTKPTNQKSLETTVKSISFLLF